MRAAAGNVPTPAPCLAPRCVQSGSFVRILGRGRARRLPSTSEPRRRAPARIASGDALIHRARADRSAPTRRGAQRGKQVRQKISRFFSSLNWPSVASRKKGWIRTRYVHPRSSPAPCRLNLLPTYLLPLTLDLRRSPRRVSYSRLPPLEVPLSRSDSASFPNENLYCDINPEVVDLETSTHINPTMKIHKALLAIIIGSALSFGFAHAADAKKDAAAASKVAGCCTKAAADSKACAHACCVAAAKEKNNCAKCGGAGAIAAKK